MIEEWCEVIAPGEPILFADGHDRAFSGVAFINHTAISVYDRDRFIKSIMDDSGMDLEDAEEFFDFNVAGAHVGPHTPAFMVSFTPRLDWCELDILLMYINDDPKRFIEHTADFGYTKKQAKAIMEDIVETLAIQAARIV